MPNRFKRQKLPTVLDLRGTLFVIPGIILMLVPFPWMEEVSIAMDAAGFLLMSLGLFLLHEKNVGFGLADWAAGDDGDGVFRPFGIVGELIPSSFTALCFTSCAPALPGFPTCCDDHEMAHHFLHHMVVDIIATAVEILVHALGRTSSAMSPWPWPYTVKPC